MPKAWERASADIGMRMFPSNSSRAGACGAASVKGLKASMEEVGRCQWEAVKFWGPGAEGCIHLGGASLGTLGGVFWRKPGVGEGGNGFIPGALVTDLSSMSV